MAREPVVGHKLCASHRTPAPTVKCIWKGRFIVLAFARDSWLSGGRGGILLTTVVTWVTAGSKAVMLCSVLDHQGLHIRRNLGVELIMICLQGLEEHLHKWLVSGARYSNSFVVGTRKQRLILCQCYHLSQSLWSFGGVLDDVSAPSDSSKV